jgi:hypothetical protein
VAETGKDVAELRLAVSRPRRAAVAECVARRSAVLARRLQAAAVAYAPVVEAAADSVPGVEAAAVVALAPVALRPEHGNP